MGEYVFGANILENLTTGMYQDSKVIYREYIQNACDQIDRAYTMGLLSKEEGRIEIFLDQDNRTISIHDNATGICAADFEHTLADIANSDKKLGEDKGFRGIGRLCGLAYCKELIFSSTAKGENTISRMKCDAEKMRRMITENERGEKHTAEEVLRSIYTFSTEHTTETDAHWFNVEMVKINEENKDLLDLAQIKEYLSFVAPVPYQNTFMFRTEVYKHAKEIGQGIDEYAIYLEGEQVFKKYTTSFKTSKGEDEVFDVRFKEIYDSEKNLLAWLWFGVSKFKGVIFKECVMRGIRLRKENIQIGGEDALQKLFKEDRGHHYFIGELFAVAKDLIPNSQRDYFNENAVRIAFETAVSKYFAAELHKAYYDGSSINSAYGKIDAYHNKEQEVEEKQKKGFVSNESKERAFADLERAKEEAEKARKRIDNKREKDEEAPHTVAGQIIDRIERERRKAEDAEKGRQQKAGTASRKKDAKKPIPSAGRRVDQLSACSEDERELIQKVYDVIEDLVQKSLVDENTKELILNGIEEKLK